MTALSNANTSRDGIKSRSIGLTSCVLPKANSSDTGVSVRYTFLNMPIGYILIGFYNSFIFSCC